MISEFSLDIKECFRMCKDLVSRICKEKGIRNIPVRLSSDYDDIGESWATFNIPTVNIIIADNISKRLSSDNPTERVRKLNSIVRHEVYHYEEYLILIKIKTYVTKSDFNEDEANRIGREFASNALKRYTVEKINPNHINDYKNFHGKKNVIVTKIDYEPPKQPLVNLGELVSIEYRPMFESNSKGSTFYHQMGDTGKKLFKTNCILATDGKNFFILKKNRKIKRPHFTSSGIIG